MMGNVYSYSAPLKDPMGILRRSPWVLAADPFQMTEFTWYISGQRWVAAYLIDTGEGLVLIDSGVPESLYLLVSAIYRSGHRPEEIKHILISHAHFDHCGAAAVIKKMSGAEIWMSEQDLAFMKKFPEEVWFPGEGCEIQKFEPDRFYRDDEPIRLGRVSIRTLLTAGHTPGCTSFFWEERGDDGRTYTVGMHGGVGPNTMSDEYYSRSKAMDGSLRLHYIEQMERLKKFHVDVTLPSHPNQIEIFDRAGTFADDRDAYVDPRIWSAFIERHQQQAKSLEGIAE